MNTSDPRDEAILNLASAIHHINMNPRSRHLAALAEFAISNAKFRDRVDELMTVTAEAGHATEASTLVAKHMPTNVSTFGSGDGLFGWTGTDAAGNRVTRKVEPAIVADDTKSSTGSPITEAMHALAERAVQLRDDKLNQLTFSLMTKLNAEAFREFLAADALRSEGASAASGVP